MIAARRALPWRRAAAPALMSALMAALKPARVSALVPALMLALAAAPASPATAAAEATAPTSGGAPAAAAAASAPAAPAGPTLADELKNARQQRDRLAALAPGTRLLEERRSALTRLVALLAARERRSAAAASAAPTPDAALPTLPGDGPFAAADVDALRDQRDALASQQATLEASLRALDRELTALVAARRKADEALRLRQEQLSRAGSADRERLEIDVELALLQARVTELEVARADDERRSSQDRLEPLGRRRAALDREVERVRVAQHIDDAALAEVSEASARARQALAREIAKARARLAAVEALAAGDDAAPRVAAALRATVTALAELDAIEQGAREAWALRRLALDAGADPSRQAVARDLLATGIEQLDARLRASQEHLDSARAGSRAQHAAIDALAGDDPRRATEQRVLDAVSREIDARERVQQSLARLRLLLSRSLGDIESASEPRTLGEWTDLAAGQAAALARSAWEYELFSATETSVVDGRPVTVNYGVTVGKSVGVVILFALGVWLARLLVRLLVAQLVRRSGVSAQFASVLHRWLMWLLALVVLIAVLKVSRVPLTAFAFLGGALAIGIGFGTQNIIKNLISGMIILFERKLRVGDIVTIGELSGTVAAVDLRATTVRGFDGIDFIVPNSTLLENQVSNWTYLNTTMRREVSVAVAYGSDLQLAIRVLLDCAAAVSGVLPDPPAEVLVARFADDGIELRLQCWVRLQAARTGPQVESDLRLAIDAGLRAAGISVPFPQRDVRVQWVGPPPVAGSPAP
jgi:small-conductance mechanosensitive channel